MPRNCGGLSRALRAPAPATPLTGLQRLNTLDFEPGLRAALCERLALFRPTLLDAAGLRPASVTLAVTRTPGSSQACFLLTQRPESLNRHAGQFALPGGRVDEGESDAAAALRELREELGLNLGPEAILGQLDDFPTRSGFRIRPFVVWVDDDSGLAPDPREVAHCHRIPLTDLLSPRIPSLHEVPYSEHPVLSIFLASLDDEIFAPTAALIYQFREVAMAGRATSVSHFEQPRFAWC